MIAILIGLIVSFLFAMRMAFNKYWCTRLGLEGRNVALLGQFLFEPIVMIAAAVLIGTDYFVETFSVDYLLKDSAAAAARGTGIVVLSVAVQYGKGGPAASLTLLQTPITTIMNASLLG